MKNTTQIKFIKEFKWLIDLLKEENDSGLIEINGESGRGGGKNVMMIMSLAIWMANPDLKFNSAVFRKQSVDLNDLWDDFEGYLPYEWEVKHKYKKSFINGNLISFNSLYTSNNKPVSGLGKSMKPGADYMIIWCDESTEITDNDRKKIKQSYARFGKKIVVINTWNPWSPHNPIVKYMADVMPYPGVEYMKKHHYQHYLERGETKIRGKLAKTTKIFFRTSAYINPFSSDAHILSLEEIAKYDEDEGNTILWCKPGVVDGAVYKNLDKALRTNEDQLKQHRFKDIIAGIDFGVSDSTSVSIVGISSDQNYRSHGVHILNEYYHTNKKGAKTMDLNDYAVEVVNYLNNSFKLLKMKENGVPVLKCFVDYARQSSKDELFVDLLQKIARENGYFHLRFEKAKKDAIRDRIVLTNYLIATDRFTINTDMAPNHVREFQNVHYDTTKTTPDGFHPRADGDDHAINAFEYALSAIKDDLHTAIIK